MVQSPDHVEDDEFNHSTQSDLETECEKLGIEVIDMELHHVGVPHLNYGIKRKCFKYYRSFRSFRKYFYEYYCEAYR